MPDSEVSQLDALSPGLDLDRLTALVLDALRQHPSGLSEYQLFKVLREHGEAAFDGSVFRDKLSMFQAHFVLFHVLYGLRDRLLRARQATLEFDCLRVILLPFGPAAPARLPNVRDPMRAYYEDLGNLAQTTRDDVEEMMAGFWRAYAHRHERAAALRALGLADPVDTPTIKRRYRTLALQHHPDRGGDEQQLKRINAAMAMLKV